MTGKSHSSGGIWSWRWYRYVVSWLVQKQIWPWYRYVVSWLVQKQIWLWYKNCNELIAQKQIWSSRLCVCDCILSAYLKCACLATGQLDSNWCIGAVLEKKLAPFPFTLALSGYANHVKSQYRFGIGMIIGWAAVLYRITCLGNACQMFSCVEQCEWFHWLVSDPTSVPMCQFELFEGHVFTLSRMFSSQFYSICLSTVCVQWMKDIFYKVKFSHNWLNCVCLVNEGWLS